MVSRIIDADGHVRELDEWLFEYLEGRYRGMLHNKTFSFFPSLDGWHVPLTSPQGREEADMRPDAARWVSVLDELGIEQAVLYPTAGLAHGLIQDIDWACTVARAYNNWLYDRYCRLSPRLKGVALLPTQDISAAVQELRRAVTEQGMVAGMVCARNLLNKPFGHPDFHPLWAEAERLDVPLVLHGAPSQGMGFDFYDTFIKVHTLEQPFPQMIQMTSIVLDGILELFPKVRVAFLEAGSSWVLWMMDRLDYEYAHAYGPVQAPLLKKQPSEYLKGGQVYVACELEERMLPAVIQHFGADKILYPSDYPHEPRPRYSGGLGGVSGADGYQ